ncbi:orotate phosphoribosyltransferase [Vulcanisaeta sp. JCM 16161]|uniref:orotate phosphoribosyltransferase n=1 Tax=Vulcanisaeta sp. JCM 16161 TaxID=1295372 RepID=UPI000AF8E516|nr:orotate phosphoribosyltransferase [Vulcanisaeta sp. JCM 16161]
MAMLSDDLAISLYRIGAIKFGRFKLTSGIESPFYIDLRLVITHPDIYRQLVKSMAGLLSSFNIDVVAGIETAGIPWASMVAYELGKGMIYVRKEAKEHGTARLIEGDLRQGMRVAVIDDVVTTGGSIIRAIRLLGATVAMWLWRQPSLIGSRAGLMQSGERALTPLPYFGLQR